MGPPHAGGYNLIPEDLPFPLSTGRPLIDRALWVNHSMLFLLISSNKRDETTCPMSLANNITY